MNSLLYPPTTLPDNLKTHLLRTAEDWSIAHGLAIRPHADQKKALTATGAVNRASVNALATTAPITLFPSPFPQACFQEALDLQKAYNELYASIASDEEWLEEIVRELIDVDDFIARLWQIHLSVKEEGYVQDISVGIFRSDYMCHVDKQKPEVSPVIKQVEFNTIAASFGGLSEKVSNLHRYLARTNIYADILGEKFTVNSLPLNESILSIADGLAQSHRAYAASTPLNYTCILFVVQDPESNIFDQRHIEYYLLENYGIQSFRVSLERVIDDTNLTDDRVLMYSPFQMQTFTSATAFSHPSIQPYEVSTIYYRAGYSPTEYTEREWSARLHLERSTAIKCPSVLTHLAGCKKVQQVLATPNSPHLARFLADEDKMRRVRDTFVPMYPMGHNREDLQYQQQSSSSSSSASTAFNPMAKGRQLGLDPHSAAHHVLKPQREGGGNNIYRKSIPSFLEELHDSQWPAYILMEMIEPPPARNMILRNGEVSAGGVISELGVFGFCLWRSKAGRVMDNKDNGRALEEGSGDVNVGHGSSSEIIVNSTAGYLLRTKGDQSEEGGVAAGFGAVDSCYLT